MSEEVLIKVDGVSKKFCRDLKTSLWYGMKDMAGEIMGRKKDEVKQLRKEEFWAVNDISFELKRGECLGLIGRNGAGKSTLLKMLNGLIKPDRGRIEMRGRVGALIELGAGFNPILTGRENIYVNGSVLGLTRKEIGQKFDAIVEFAEIEEFIDSPVQNYSSGMKVRLGFAVAAQLSPDILLIDEILAVGDIGFVLKCFNKMDELLPDTALVFVTHNMPQVSRMCTSLIVMAKGEAVYQDTNVSKGISYYYDFFEQKMGNFTGSDQAELLEIFLSSGGKTSVQGSPFHISHGDDLHLHMKIKINRPVHNPSINLAFFDKEQRNFAEVFNFSDFCKISEFAGTLSVAAKFPEVQFGQGIYSITVSLTDNSDNRRRAVFRIQSAIYFNVLSKKHGWAPMQFNPAWEIVEIQE